ncbi:MAG: MFS transporter [Bifidobacterium psychraerophilum]|uniref:MFS transporter n=1 Tax=Bifidobacterium psychraerophilum TaxID=218140 RepID=UPI0039ECF909
MTLNEEMASSTRQQDLAPDTGLRMSRQTKIRFGIGFVLFSLLWMTAGSSGSQVLFPQRFTELGIGVPEVILGTMNSVGSVFALVANWLFGALSDMTRSRFGKRTPWIVAGGVVTAAGYLFTSYAPSVALIVAGWCVVQVGVNMMIAPAVAVLSDRIPESYRGTFSALYGGAAIVGQSLGTLIGAQFIESMRSGFIIGTVLFLITGITTVLVWPREGAASPAVPQGEGQHAEPSAKLTWRMVRDSFSPPRKDSRDYYLALVGRLALLIGWSMISTYQLYILQKYCGLSVGESAAVISSMSVISMIALIATTVISGPVSDKLGKRKLLVAIGAVVIAVGMAIPYFMPTATGMMLYAGIAGVGYGIYTAVDQALNIDVLPNKQEAGKDLGILNLANTVGQVLAPVLVSALVVETGNYGLIFPVAIATVLVGAVVIMLIKRVR